MKFWLPVFLAVGLCLGSISADDQSRYDYYRLYRLKLTTEEQVEVLQDLQTRSDCYTFYVYPRSINQTLPAMVPAHKIAEITDIIHRYGIEYEITNNNIQATIDAERKTIKPLSATPEEFDWDHYNQLETIYEWLDHLAKVYPDKVTLLDVGVSYEGRPLKGVKLSHKANNTAVFVEGGVHAREWISPAVSTFILNQLLTSTDPKVQDIAQNFDWFFFPVFNPDGYRYTFSGDRMWRKTRKPNGACVGTDPNRNWDSHWNSTGSSPNSCRNEYAGPSAFSEPEIEQFAKFILSNANSSNIRTYFSLHAFSQLLMFPYGYTKEKPRNFDDLTAIGTKAVEAIRQRYGTGFVSGSVEEVIYPSSGCSVDWVYDAVGIPMTFIFELRGTMFSPEMFILPADQITPSGWEILDAFVTILTEARKLGYYDADYQPNLP